MSYEFLHKIDNPTSTTDPEPEPHQHYEVHCGRCKWWGMLSQLTELGCPMCLSDEWLEYKEKA